MESIEDERIVCGRVRSGKQSAGNLKKNSDPLCAPARARARVCRNRVSAPHVAR